jgi:hypothetical protein
MSKALKGLAVAGLIVVTGGAAVAGLVAAGAITSVAVATAAINAVMGLAAMTALNGISSALAKKPNSSMAGNAGIQMESTGSEEPRRIIYGRQRVGGSLVLPWITTGTDNAFLHHVMTVAGHEIDAYELYHINDVESVTPGSITGASTDGQVTTGAYANVMWLRGYRGTASQTVDYILDTALPEWTSNHRGRGVAYLASQLKYSESAYRTGKPDLSVTVRGKKCYDPRLDTSPGANPTNASYIAWTANPALCLADYLTDTVVGLGENPARIDWTMVVTAANICDENVLIPDGIGGNLSLDRYECHVTLSATDDYAANKAVLESAMLGSCIWSGGKWRMRAGAWQGSLFTLTDDDVAGSFNVTPEIRNGEKYNDVRGSFLDAADLHRQKQFQPRYSTAYQTTDGEVKPRLVQFGCWTNEYMCQRGAIILLRQSRGKQTITVECKLSAFKIRPGETGTATFSEIGWTNQTCRCLNWEFMPEGMVKLTLRQESSTDWSDPVWNTEYTVPGTLTTPSAGYTRPGTPTALTITPAIGGIRVQLTAGDPTIPGQTYALYRHTASTPFSSATQVWEGSATDFLLNLGSDGTTYYYWIVARYQGRSSAERPAGAGTAAAALPVPTVGGTTLTLGAGITQAGSTLTKVSGATDWNAHAYSREGYSSGAYVSARASNTSTNVMFGLNSDPTTDASYTSLDFAWYFDAGTLRIYESSSLIATIAGGYATSTVLAVAWDGGTVRYYRDGVVIREVVYSSASGPLFFDSSFYQVGAELNSVTFIPLGIVPGGTIQGAALNRDPNFRDASAWWDFAAGSVPMASARFTTVTDGVAGNSVLRSPTNSEIWANGTDRIAIDANKTYRISGWARRNSAANGTLYIGVGAFDSSGTNINGDGTQWSYQAATGATMNTTWTRYEAVFGAGTSKTFPSNARTMTPLVILNYTGTAGYAECQDLRIEEVAPTALIAPNAVTRPVASSTNPAGAGYGNSTTVHSYAFTADANGILDVIATFTMAQGNDWDNGCGARLELDNDTDVTTAYGTSRASIDLSGAAVNAKFFYSLNEQFSITSGKSYTLRLKNYKSGGTSSYWNVLFTMAQVKR